MAELLSELTAAARELARPLDRLDLALLAAVCAAIAVIDARELRIPDWMLLLGVAALVAKRIFVGPPLNWWMAAEAAVGGGYFLVFWWASRGRLGLGDAKLSAFLAAGLGLVGWLVAVVSASLAAITWGMVGVALGRRRLADPIPLAPFLLAGTVVGWAVVSTLL